MFGLSKPRQPSSRAGQLAKGESRSKLMVVVAACALLTLASACGAVDAGASVREQYEQLTRSGAKAIEIALRGPAGSLISASLDEHVLETNLLREVGDRHDPTEVWPLILAQVAQNYGDFAAQYEEIDPRVVLPVTPADVAAPGADVTGPGLQVEVLLDVSGSMAEKDESGMSKIDAAREAILAFVADLPARARVAVRVFGQEGARTGKNRQDLCAATALVQPFGEADEKRLELALATYRPTGWTPIAAALAAAQTDLAAFPAASNLNLIYLVTDGMETCGGNPVHTITRLRDSSVQPIVNVIGFDASDQAQIELAKLAEAGQGRFTAAEDHAALAAGLQRAVQELEQRWNDWLDQTFLARQSAQAEKAAALQTISSNMTARMEEERLHVRTAITILRKAGRISDNEAEALVALADERWNALKDYNNAQWQAKTTQLLASADQAALQLNALRSEAAAQIAETEAQAAAAQSQAQSEAQSEAQTGVGSPASGSQAGAAPGADTQFPRPGEETD